MTTRTFSARDYAEARADTLAAQTDYDLGNIDEEELAELIELNYRPSPREQRQYHERLREIERLNEVSRTRWPEEWAATRPMPGHLRKQARTALRARAANSEGHAA